MNAAYKLINNEKPPVTIAIGILCDDAVLMASDSQTTIGGTKTQDANKLRVIKLKDAEVLIAEAGSAASSQRAIEIMEELGRDVSITDYRSVADLACRAMAKLKQELRRAQLDCSMEELARLIISLDQDCALMIAHYFNGQPYIFIADLINGAANKIADDRTKHFAVMGSGSDLGRYLMRELSRKGMPFNPAFATLVYAIGEIKANDQYCSGSTRFAFVTKDNSVTFLPQSLINEIADQIERFNKNTLAERNKKVTAMLEEASVVWFKKAKAADWQDPQPKL